MDRCCLSLNDIHRTMDVDRVKWPPIRAIGTRVFFPVVVDLYAHLCSTIIIIIFAAIDWTFAQHDKGQFEAVVDGDGDDNCFLKMKTNKKTG